MTLFFNSTKLYIKKKKYLKTHPRVFHASLQKQSGKRTICISVWLRGCVFVCGTVDVCLGGGAGLRRAVTLEQKGPSEEGLFSGSPEEAGQLVLL